MALSLDPELLAIALKAMAEGTLTPRQPTARGDWSALRAVSEDAWARIGTMLPPHPEVKRTDHRVTSYDGADILARWYLPAGAVATPGPAAVYLHGGGMIAGSVEQHDPLIAGYAADSNVPLLAVDYRRAPEHSHPTPVEDAYAGLAWLAEHAAEFEVDPARIAVMGESAGGGLAAGVALLARERGLAVARQILVSPMLDDRTIDPDPVLTPLATWTYDDNYTGWHALLGDAVASPDVSQYAAPARARDLSELPPAYIEVGELDVLRDESITYACGLLAAGVSAELHVHPGCPHGFDRFSADADVAQRARADRLRALTGY